MRPEDIAEGILKRKLDVARRRVSSRMVVPRITPKNVSEKTADSVEVDPEDSGRRSLKSRLSIMKKKAQEKVEAKIVKDLEKRAKDAIKKEIVQRLAWRSANMAMGATVILVFLTILVWTVQFIGGNMMGSKLIPKLGLGETILWIIGLIVISALIDLILLGITMMAQVFEDPIGLINPFGKIILEVFWGALKANFTGS